MLVSVAVAAQYDEPPVPQVIWPAAHAHTPVWQVAPEPHVWPHAPQLAESDVRLTHTPLQAVSPLGHAQVPLTQLAPLAHLRPHAPQLFTSAERSAQLVPQLT